MNNTELEILKDKYAMGTLSEAEYASLEVEILQNPNLENELKTHNDLVQGVNYAGELELQEMLDKLHYQRLGTQPKENSTPKSSNKWIILAGLITFIAILAYFVLANSTKEEPAKIYAEFYSTYKPSLQGRGVNEDEAVVIFNDAYENGNYISALKAIKPYLDQSKNNIKLTAAIAANEVDDLVLAESLLDEIIEANDYYFTDHALWYKALIKLKTEETATIKEILTPLIANPKADHHSEAKRLLDKIEG